VSEASRVLPRVEAEEAAQEALVRAWLRRDSCRCPGAPLPWLLEITRNEARRLMGRQARRSSHELVAAADLQPDCEDRELVGTALRLSVEQAIGTLADGDRRLLNLRYTEDLTQSEVALRLGVPEGTVLLAE
jgi:RNA polymerase sigma factor (sigma-70 family)